LDEGENLDGDEMRYVLDANHPDGKVTRTVQGRKKEFRTFAAIVFAAIGTKAFHVSVLSRSIKINLQRRKRPGKLRRYDQNDTGDLDMAYAYAREWIERNRENISRDPPMPEHDGRVMDNWRLLIALAEASSDDWGERARAAMLALSADQADINVMLLEHIRIVFERGDGVVATTTAGNAIPTQMLLAKLHVLDVADGRWQRYCGLRGTASPRKLTDRSLADLLEPFNVRPDQYRPRGGKQFRGYACASFEEAWEAYCPREGAPQLRLVAKRDDDDDCDDDDDAA
jgi:hypothetical protein